MELLLAVLEKIKGRALDATEDRAIPPAKRSELRGMVERSAEFAGRVLHFRGNGTPLPDGLNMDDSSPITLSANDLNRLAREEGNAGVKAAYQNLVRVFGAIEEIAAYREAGRPSVFITIESTGAVIPVADTQKVEGLAGNFCHRNHYVQHERTATLRSDNLEYAPFLEQVVTYLFDQCPKKEFGQNLKAAKDSAIGTLHNVGHTRPTKIRSDIARHIEHRKITDPAVLVYAEAMFIAATCRDAAICKNPHSLEPYTPGQTTKVEAAAKTFLEQGRTRAEAYLIGRRQRKEIRPGASASERISESRTNGGSPELH